MPGPLNDKDVADQVSKLYELHQSGALTKAEFETAKQRVIGENPPPSINAPQQESYEEPEKQPRSTGKTLLIIAALVVFAIGIGALGGDGDDDSNANRQASAPTATTQPVQSDTGPLLTGIVVLMNTSNTDTPGEACYGVGDHAMFTEGAEVSVTAIGGHQDRTARLSDGTVDQYGHCRMAFGIEWFDVDEYQFGFDNDFFVHCDRDAIVDIDTNYTTQVRIAPNGAYCQEPAS